jgi:hypothetical protein
VVTTTSECGKQEKSHLAAPIVFQVLARLGNKETTRDLLPNRERPRFPKDSFDFSGALGVVGEGKDKPEDEAVPDLGLM